jgi:hypothetical protein
MVGTGKFSGGGAGVLLSLAISWHQLATAFRQPDKSRRDNKKRSFSAVVLTIRLCLQVDTTIIAIVAQACQLVAL